METLLRLALILLAPSAPDCSISAAFHGPAAGESIAVATATGRTEDVSAVASPLMWPGRSGPGNDLLSPVRAYEFVVDHASFSDPMMPGTWGLFIPGDTLLVVPWALTGDCEPVRFGTERWVPADSQVVIRASHVRREGHHRVVDAVGPLNGFPYSTHVPAGIRIPSDRAELMPAWDFLNLLDVAPRRDSDTERADQLTTLENAYRGGPTYLLERFPGPEMLEWARGWAADGNED